LLRVTFIHPKACFPLPLVSGLYALGKGGLNLTLQQYIYTRFSRGLSPVLARLEVGVRVGREAQAREVIRELYVQTRRQGGRHSLRVWNCRGWSEYAQSYFQLLDGPKSRSSFCRDRLL